MDMKKARKRKIPIQSFALAIDRLWIDIPGEHLASAQQQPFLEVISRTNGNEVALIGRMASSKMNDLIISTHLDKNMAPEDAKIIKRQRAALPSGPWDQYDSTRPGTVMAPLCYCFQNPPFAEHTKKLSICPMRFILEFTDQMIKDMVLQVAQQDKKTTNGTKIHAIGMHGDMRWLKPDNRAAPGQQSGYIEMSEVHYNPNAEPLQYQTQGRS